MLAKWLSSKPGWTALLQKSQKAVQLLNIPSLDVRYLRSHSCVTAIQKQSRTEKGLKSCAHCDMERKVLVVRLLLDKDLALNGAGQES